MEITPTAVNVFWILRRLKPMLQPWASITPQSPLHDATHMAHVAETSRDIPRMCLLLDISSDT